LLFIGLSIANVVFSTIKSIVTINGTPFSASMISALYYGYYNIVLIYTVADFPLWQKVLVTFGCNLVGVYAVKWAEAKGRKEKLWRIEVTVPGEFTKQLHERLNPIPHNYIENVGKYSIFNIYCGTQMESSQVKKILVDYNAKYFVTETKEL
jgi:hypothetical protein